MPDVIEIVTSAADHDGIGHKRDRKMSPGLGPTLSSMHAGAQNSAERYDTFHVSVHAKESVSALPLSFVLVQC